MLSDSTTISGLAPGLANPRVRLGSGLIGRVVVPAVELSSESELESESEVESSEPDDELELEDDDDEDDDDDIWDLPTSPSVLQLEVGEDGREELLTRRGSILAADSPVKPTRAKRKAK